MKKSSSLLYYLALAGVCFFVMRFLVLKMPFDDFQVAGTQSSWSQFLDSVQFTLHHPLSVLLLQIITILFAARFLGYLFSKIRQPAVIGEIVAGILLGPTLLGHYFPEISTFIFPENSFGNLQFISQVGLILFMFAIGMELDFGMLKGKAKNALIISHTAVWLSFTLGVVLAYYMYDRYAVPGSPFLSFALFVGISMSITAFPVLARVVQERGLMKTPLGGLAMTAAAIDDITAWCLLAAVVAVVKAGTAAGAVYNILFTFAYVLSMLVLVRPFMKRIGEIYGRKKQLSRSVIAIAFLVLLISAYIADLLGIHALFGAFLAGIVMPPSLNFRRILTEKTEDVALIIFLPLFFVYSGLRTKLGLLDNAQLWNHTLIIIAFATVGKFFGAYLGSRLTRQTLSDSLKMGALMNTRGLMELVVLNIGLDLGVLSQQIFSMLVVMALVTTFMTGPLLELIQFVVDKKSPRKEPESNKFKVLVSFANPNKIPKLLRVAALFTHNSDKGAITVLHLSNTNEVNYLEANQVENEIFSTIQKAAKEEKLQVEPAHLFTHEYSRDLLDFAKKGHFDLLLMGAGQSIYQGSLLGSIMGFTVNVLNPEKLIGSITRKESLFPGDELIDEKTRNFLESGKTSVGVMVDRGLETPKFLYVFISGNADLFLVKYARMFERNNENVVIHFVDPKSVMDKDLMFDSAHEDVHLSTHIPTPIDVSKGLLVCSHSGFRYVDLDKSIHNPHLPSILIIKP